MHEILKSHGVMNISWLWTGFTFYRHENTRGNLWNLEVIYKKTSAVTPYFYCFNILSELTGNAGEKNEEVLRKEISTK